MMREIDWQRYDELKASGLQGRPLARELGVPDTTLRRAEKRREQEGTPQVPMRVPQETQVPTTAMSPPPATISDLQRLLREQEARIKQYVDQRIQESIQQGSPLELSPQRLQLPMGTPVPEYPDDAKKDSRMNLHLSAEESWEVHVVAAAFGMTPSRLIRRLWQAYRESPQAQQLLRHMRNSQGTPEENA
jgi:hypothetical protein